MPEFTRQHFEISLPGFQSAKNQATFHGGLPRLCSSYRVCASIKLCMSNSQWLFDLHCWSFTHLVPLCQEHIPLFLPNQWHLSWWRHQMETFSVLLAICEGNSPVPGEFPSQRPVTRSFDVFFALRLNKRLNKQSWGWWFETLSSPLWRHSNVAGDCISVGSEEFTRWPFY